MATIKNIQSFEANISPNVANATIAGSTSGNLFWNMPFDGSTYKKVIIYCDFLDGTADITFSSEFSKTPTIVTTSDALSGLVSQLSTTGCRVTGATSIGFIILEGY